jgi:hypothetical protein
MKKGILFFGVFSSTLLVGWFVVPNSDILIPETHVASKSVSMENHRIGLQDESHLILESQLLETGKHFPAAQILANSGEKWLGLFKSSGGYFLYSTEIIITPTSDGDVITKAPIIDDESSKTRRKVDVVDENKPIFLLKNTDYLDHAEIATYLDGYTAFNQSNVPGSVSLKLGIEREFGVGNNIGRLSVESDLDENGQNTLFLIYSLNGNSQILHSSHRADANYVGTLYWVGDLDNDQKPDFYFDLYVGDYVQNRCLFLSSKAENGRLLRKVANFRISDK